jgi:hypothetical protein
MKTSRPEFKHNCYIVTLEDLQGKVSDFPFNKILQYKYITSCYVRGELIRPLRPILRAFRQGECNYSTTVKALEAEVVKIKAANPTCFKQYGWYDTKCWEDLPGNEDLKKKRLATIARREKERLQCIEDEKARAKAILGNRIAFIKEAKALECKVYTLSEVKQIARKCKIRGTSFFSINMELDNILAKTKNGYIIEDARARAIRHKERMYIDDDGHECFIELRSNVMS